MHNTNIVRSVGPSLKRWTLGGLLAVTVSVPLAHAGAVTDPANDFIPSFTGAKSGELDVLATSASFDGTTIHLAATLNGTVGVLPSSLYVFGIDRGKETSNFAAIGAAGVVFDSVITVTGAGVVAGRDLVTNTALAVPGVATISGSSIALDVPVSLLPSLGLTPAQYGVNLWPRDTSQPGTAAISDFDPDNSTFPVGAATATAVPEPGSLALLAGGVVLGVGRLARRRRKA